MENSCMSKIWPGSIVIAYWHIEEVWKLATVINRYGDLSYPLLDGESGNYPDLVTLRFHDGKPDYDSKGHFTSGVTLQDCFINNCPECKIRYLESSWQILRDIAIGVIPSYSHKQMIKLLRPKDVILS
jgi:hypothetical protein